MQDLLTAVGPNARRGIRSSITIQKAKIRKGCLIASFSEKLDNELAGRDFESVKCNDQAHPDLLTAFRKLVPHFCLITQQLPYVITPEDGDEEAAQASAEALAPFSVTGISYDPKGTGFTLTGTREIDTDQPLNLNTPHVTFDWARENGFAELVDLLFGEVNQEVELALRGKCAEAGRQLNMFLSEESQTGQLLPGTGRRDTRLLGAHIEDVEAEEVTDEEGEPEQPKKRGRGRPKKHQ